MIVTDILQSVITFSIKSSTIITSFLDCPGYLINVGRLQGLKYDNILIEIGNFQFCGSVSNCGLQENRGGVEG